jgi:hypothetical protein
MGRRPSARASLGLVFFAAANILEYVAVPWQRRRQPAT